MKKKREETLHVPVSQIIADPANQPREELDRGLIARIERSMRERKHISPLLVTSDVDDPLSFERATFTLYDGFHRHAAALRIGAGHLVPVEIKETHAQAFQTAMERHARGKDWSKQDAMRHATRGFRDGVYTNADGAPWPVSVLAAQYSAYGVKRGAMTRWLEDHAYGVPADPKGRTRKAREGIKPDAVLAEVLERSRAHWDKQNRTGEILEPLELRRRKDLKNQRTAESYLNRAAELLRSIPAVEREATLQRFRGQLAFGGSVHSSTSPPRPLERSKRA